jgi:hypothetical protein
MHLLMMGYILRSALLGYFIAVWTPYYILILRWLQYHCYTLLWDHDGRCNPLLTAPSLYTSILAKYANNDPEL